MSDQAGEQLGEAVGSIQEFPPIWNQIGGVNVKLSDYQIKQTLSGMARKQEAKSPVHGLWYEVRRIMDLNL